MAVDLSDQEWGQVMFVLANAEGKGITWGLVNPLLMKIGEQLRGKLPAAAAPVEEYTGRSKRKNSGEVDHAQ